jgi:hypothetical protein
MKKCPFCKGAASARAYMRWHKDTPLFENANLCMLRIVEKCDKCLAERDVAWQDNNVPLDETDELFDRFVETQVAIWNRSYKWLN